MRESRRQPRKVIRVFFLIRSLDRGGAQRQLIELVGALDKRFFHVTVCTFYDGGALRPELERVAGVHVISLAKVGRWDVFRFLIRLHRAAASCRPDIFHGYMPVANELALLMARLLDARCVWGIRASNMDLSGYGRLARCAFRIGAWLSRFPDAIIVNSEAGRAHYASNGYRSERMTVIPNGIDCERFRPDAPARERVRAEWRADSITLVGLVARLDPMKDHPNFLRAAAILKKMHKNVGFVCVGDGPSQYAERLASEALELDLDILWTGARDDIDSVYNALDIVVLSSAFGEGFPNAVGEAMAAGKPCVTTRVGDAATVVGETGIVVPPQDSSALAEALGALVGLTATDLEARGKAARSRILNKFSTRRLAEATVRILSAVVRAGV